MAWPFGPGHVSGFYTYLAVGQVCVKPLALVEHELVTNLSSLRDDKFSPTRVLPMLLSNYVKVAQIILRRVKNMGRRPIFFTSRGKKYTRCTVKSSKNKAGRPRTYVKDTN